MGPFEERVRRIIQSVRVLPAISFIIIVLATVIGIGYLYRNAQQSNTSNSSDMDTSATTAIITVEQLEQGVVLQLEDGSGVLYDIKNREQFSPIPGAYTVSFIADSLGYLRESIQITENKLNTFSFSLQDLPPDYRPDSYSALPFTEILPDQNTLSIIHGMLNESSRAVGIIPHPQEQGYAVVIDSNTQSEAQNDQELVVIRTGTDTPSPSEQPTDTSDQDTNTQEGGPDQAQETREPDSLETISKNCEFARVQYNLDGNALRYFKLCPESSQNGFYSFNFTSGTETRLLPTSDPTNIQRVSFHPQEESLVYSKADGEFGYVKNNTVYPVFNDTRYGAATFSPDGLYILVIRAKDVQNPQNYQEGFAQEVLQIDWQEFQTLGTQAQIVSLGDTFYIPRPDSSLDLFWQWIDDDSLYVGDSSTIFNLNGNPQLYEPLPANYSAGQIVSGPNAQYILYNGIISTLEGERIATRIDKLILHRNTFYFTIDDFLYRIENNKAVLAYPDTLALVKSQGDSMTLITTRGNIVTGSHTEL